MAEVSSQMTNHSFAAMLRADVYRDSATPEATEKSLCHFPVANRTSAKQSTTLEIVLPVRDCLVKVGAVMEVTLRQGDMFWRGNGRVFFGETEQAFWSFSGFAGEYHSLILKTPCLAQLEVMIGGRIVRDEGATQSR